MKQLLTKTQSKQLPTLERAEQDRDPMVYAKIDVPELKSSWYIMAQSGEEVFFGFKESPWPDFISFSEADLYAIWERGGMDVLSDSTFQPCLLSELRTRLGR